MKKSISLGLITAISLCSTIPAFANEKSDNLSMIYFNELKVKDDIKNHWAEKEIREFISKGYIGGYSDGSFKPNNPITRAEFIKTANSFFGYDIGIWGFNQFKDVKEGQWFYHDISVATYYRYINGKSKDIFAPNDNITREEAASILTNINKNKDTDFDKIDMFIDAKLISSWAKSSLEGSIEASYINGYSDKTLKPKSNITRAEAVVMLSRIKTRCEQVRVKLTKKGWGENSMTNDVHKNCTIFQPMFGSNGIDAYIESHIENDLTYDKSLEQALTFMIEDDKELNRLISDIKNMNPMGEDKLNGIYSDREIKAYYYKDKYNRTILFIEFKLID